MTDLTLKEVDIYTDGCSLGNPSDRTGAGVVLCYNGMLREISEFLGAGTNNTAELQAVIVALKALKEPCKVNIYSDSQFVVQIAKGAWSASSNLDLWAEYYSIALIHNITLHWIRKDSHSLNKKAHVLANRGANNG